MSRQEDALREDIKRTRAELADTVEKLVGKTDVRGRATAKAGELRDRAATAGKRTVARVQRDPVPVAVGALLGAAAVAALVRGLTV